MFADASGVIYQATDDGPPLPCRCSVWYGGRYLAVKVWVDERLVPRAAHRLALMAFAGPPPADKPQVRHLDGDSLNNCPSNLVWGDDGDQAKDRRRHGRVLQGDRHPNAKLTVARVRAIRRRKWPAQVYADRYGVSVKTVYAVMAVRTWRHLDDGSN